MAEQEMAPCAECKLQFQKRMKRQKYCTKKCCAKAKEKMRPKRTRPGRKRPYSPKEEARRQIRDKDKIRARELAKKAFKHPRPCETCGGVATDRHHDNYNKPLEITWLCEPCHMDWHKNNKAIPPAKPGQQILIPA